MDVPTRTTEGLPIECPLCGKLMSATPGEPISDFVCPHCGSLFFGQISNPVSVPDDLKRLAERGVHAETDDEGEVVFVQFTGKIYDDQAVPQLAKLNGIPVIDIRNTAITSTGATELRSLLPDATIIH